MGRALIVGAAGFVGKYLTRELEEAGHTVFPTDMPEVNLLDKASLEAAIRKSNPDYIVNLAAISSVGASWKNPTLTMDVNVKGTLYLLEAIQELAPHAKTLLIGAPRNTPNRNPPSRKAIPCRHQTPMEFPRLPRKILQTFFARNTECRLSVPVPLTTLA